MPTEERQGTRQRRVAQETAIPFSSPALPQSAVKEIPEQVEAELCWPSGPVVHGRSNSHIEPEVLALTQRDLYFRNDVPVCCCSGLQFAICEEFHHWCPGTACRTVWCEDFSGCSAEEVGIRDLFRVGRQFEARLDLK